MKRYIKKLTYGKLIVNLVVIAWLGDIIYTICTRNPLDDFRFNNIIVVSGIIVMSSTAIVKIIDFLQISWNEIIFKDPDCEE